MTLVDAVEQADEGFGPRRAAGTARGGQDGSGHDGPGQMGLARTEPAATRLATEALSCMSVTLPPDLDTSMIG